MTRSGGGRSGDRHTGAVSSSPARALPAGGSRASPGLYLMTPLTEPVPRRMVDTPLAKGEDTSENPTRGHTSCPLCFQTLREEHLSLGPPSSILPALQSRHVNPSP